MSEEKHTGNTITKCCHMKYRFMAATRIKNNYGR